MESSAAGYDQVDKEEVDGKSKIDPNKTYFQKIFGGKKPTTETIITTQKEQDLETANEEEDKQPRISNLDIIDRTAQISEREDVYHTEHIDSIHRRTCIIIENYKFDKILEVKDRRGHETDRELIENIFKRLQFKVTILTNKKIRDINKALDNAQNEDYTDVDVFAIVVMSHGEEGKLYAADKKYNTEKIWEPFTADQCPSLAGKPKLFFFQACQGDKLDAGTLVKEERSTSIDGLEGFASYKTPQHADFVLAHSTIDGYFAWRHTRDGSWFIQALVAALSKNNATHDLLSILTKTTQMVSKFESNSFSTPTHDRKKQTPFVYSTLTKKLYITEKIDKDNK